MEFKKRWRHCLLVLVLMLGMTAGLMPNVNETACAATDSDSYGYYLITDNDPLSDISYKQITFNDIAWYVVDDHSEEEDGYVTLLAAMPISVSAFSAEDDENYPTNQYSRSTIRKYLDSLTEKGGSFYDVAEYIKTTTVKGSDGDDEVNAKLYIPNITELLEMSWRALSFDAKGYDGGNGGFWLRNATSATRISSCNAGIAPSSWSESARSLYLKYSYMSDIIASDVSKTFCVRPVLRLDTSLVKLVDRKVVPNEYKDYIPSSSDSESELAQKIVKFNGRSWYIINDYSKGTNEFVTLFAAEPYPDDEFENRVAFNSEEENNNYSKSTVKDYLSSLTETGGAFSRVADAISTISVKGSDSDSAVSAKLYLLSADEAKALPAAVRKHKATRALSYWWLRSPANSSGYASFVSNDGTIYTNNFFFNHVQSVFVIRPALTLNTGKVVFYPEDRSFRLAGDVASVKLDKSSATIQLNYTDQLNVTVQPSGKTVVWSSDDTSVATVDSSGNVKAVGLGETSIRAYCDNGTSDYTGDDETAVCTVKVQNLVPAEVQNMIAVYDGEPHGLSVSGEAADKASVKYGTTKNKYNLSKSPTITNVSEGPLTVYYKISASGYIDKTGSATITIAKAEPSIVTAPMATNPSYTGKAQALVKAGEASGGEMQYSLDGKNYSKSIPQGKDKMEYTIYFKIVGDSNHNDSEPLTIKSTIGAESASVTKAPASLGVTYTGEDQALVSEGTAKNGEMYYSLDGVKFSKDIPKGNQAGSYTVYYYAKGSGTYIDSAVEKLEAVVDPKPVTLTADDASKSYDAKDPAFSAHADGLVGDDTVEYTVSREAGEHAGTYAIIPEAVELQGNYRVICVNGSFTINKAASNSVTVSLKNWKEGQNPNTPSSKASFGTAEYSYSESEDGIFDAAVPADAGIWYVKATVKETDDYPGCEAVAAFEITPAVDTSGAYANYLAKDDDADTLAAKEVYFNGVGWYIIQDNSASVTSGYLTLLAARHIATLRYEDSAIVSTTYTSSVPRKYLTSLTDGSRTGEAIDFTEAADAIRTVTLDKSSSGAEMEAKLYLLSYSEFNSMISKGSVLAKGDGEWWLRNGSLLLQMADLVNANGETDYDNQVRYHYVRPALQLDLTKVGFDYETQTFELKNNVSRITLSKRELSMDSSERAQLTATVTPADASVQEVIWASTDPSVASVDQTGEVTTWSDGTATITATATNGTEDTADDKVATCRVIAGSARFSDNGSSGQTIYKSSLPKTEISRIAKAKNAVNVKWKQLSKKKRTKITGFQVQISANKTFSKKTKTVKVKGKTKVSKTIGKLKSKKTYYVRVRTYKVSGKKIYVGKWSKTRKVKTK